MSAKTAKSSKTAKKAAKPVAKTTAKTTAKLATAKPATKSTAKPAAKPAAKAAPSAPNRKPNSSSSASKARAAAVTREALAADVAAFKKAGGEIIVLGHTPLRPRVAPASGAKKSPTTPAAAASGKSGS